MSAAEHVVSLERLSEITEQAKRNGKRVVQCHGTFDLLHPGHMRHLERAASEGDMLVVTITADRFVNKGPNRPAFPEQLRAESLAQLACVDWVAVNHDFTAVPAITKVRPDIYVKGQDYKVAESDITGNILLEKNAVEAHGGRILFTEEIVFSSSSLINEHLSLFPPRTKAYLDNLKKLYNAEQIIEQVQALSDMRVLVVGEAIIDEYCYASPMGLTGKGGNIIAARYESKEQFAGGSLAIANHLSGFVKEVGLLTGLGRNCPHESFIHKHLQDNITPHFFHYEEAPTLVKRRYVDGNVKMFEIYFYDPEPLTPTVDAAFISWIEEHAADYDMVIVPDYGNGLLSPGIVDALCRKSRYLAVNTQINSGNRGYHVINRYARADFVSLNEPEVRLAAHDRVQDLEAVAAQVGQGVNAKQMAITMGPSGALLLDIERGEAFRTPALTTQVVDIIGAGDAFLTLAALASGAKLSPDIAVFLGSAAAALDVQIVCNREHITPVSLYKFITALFK
ncbi:PfkB family carbohydrate kinase [Magnetofaba australis]|uniref:Putative cytidyltransferase-like protein n=1 Tax=Magnetofaba australis IT-1 TaxID=1434232 RepID=A0A1Y2K4C0_9PROT|nr:PfkB family carbohydrate kinase [Magnetofaba australis]OSM04218.1 putative cytidyltransferase-like protein [Magnetofaba australis IT-1]